MKSKKIKNILKGTLLTILLIVIGAGVYNYPKLAIISGYAAKNMASGVFFAERSEQSINENDNNVPLIKLADSELEPAKKQASASVFGLNKRTAVYREGLGSSLVGEDYDPKALLERPQRKMNARSLPFPYGNNGLRDSTFKNIDYQKLQKALDYAFSKPELQRTTAAVIVYKDHLIAEKYAPGFTKETPLLGWSMNKSIIATLFGILQHRGELNVMDAAPISQWQEDERRNITLNHLLRMQSGLEWSEDYGGISDVNKMLYLDADVTKAQIEKKAIGEPGEIWNYSSGTSNLLSGVLRDYLDTRQAYLDFPYTELIDKIGMHSMLIETDEVGNFIASSYGWANARDWAKFGLLYLHRGNWNGEQLFAPEWVDYATAPTRNTDGVYGAHFWLNSGGRYPDVPEDMFSADGHQGQFVIIIPSLDLVVVRMGFALYPDFDLNTFLKHIIEAIGVDRNDLN
ncbi:MAG: serine hydrolase [Maribacter sp.]